MYRINYFSSFKNIHQIWQHEDGNWLYLGDYSAALDTTMLKAKNIQTGRSCGYIQLSQQQQVCPLTTVSTPSSIPCTKHWTCPVTTSQSTSRTPSKQSRTG